MVRMLALIILTFLHILFCMPYRKQTMFSLCESLRCNVPCILHIDGFVDEKLINLHNLTQSNNCSFFTNVYIIYQLHLIALFHVSACRFHGFSQIKKQILNITHKLAIIIKVVINKDLIPFCFFIFEVVIFSFSCI